MNSNTNIMAVHNIYRSASYFYYVMKILGMAPYTFDRKCFKFRTTSLDYLRLIGTLAGWIYINFVHIQTYDSRRYKLGIQFKIIDGLWMNCYFFQTFAIPVILFFNFIRRKNVENLLKSIHDFDVRIEKLGLQFKAKQCKTLRYIAPLGLLILSGILMWLLWRSWTGIENFDRFIFYLKFLAFVEVLGIYFMICMTFIGSCFCIATRLDVLKNIMR